MAKVALCSVLFSLPIRAFAMGNRQLLAAFLIAFAASGASYAQSSEGQKLFNKGSSAYQRGDIHGAARFFEQAWRIVAQQLGEDHPDTLASMANLALTYSDLGQHDKALALNEQTLKLTRTKLGEDHPDTLASMANLAATYNDLGQHDKALTLNEQTLKLRRAKLGEDHQDTLQTMSNLAITYGFLGQYDKALALHEQTLKLKRAKLGKDHPDTLVSMNNLARTYRDLGQLDQALALHEQTLKLSRAKLGEGHPFALFSMGNLAIAYSDQGQHDKALALHEQTLILMRAKLGKDHPDTLLSMSNLAATYSDLGQHDKALALNEQTLKLSRAKLGEDHPDTLLSMGNLAATHNYLRQHDKSLALNEQTLKLRRAKLGEDHPDTLVSMNNLARTYRDLGQLDQALALIPTIFAGVEKQRTLPGLGTEQRQSIFIAWSDRYQTYAAFHAQAGQPDKAFDLGDLSKARTLTDSIRGQIALRSLPAAEQQRLHASETKGQQLRLQLDKLAAGARDSAALLALQKEIDNHNITHVELLAELGKRYPKFAQQNTIKPAGVAQANKLLREGEAFVSYLIDKEGKAQAYVLDRSGKVVWVDLGSIGSLAQTVAATRALLAPEDEKFESGQLVALKGGGFQWLPKDAALPAGATPAKRRNLGVVATATSGAQGGPVTAPAEALAILQRYWHDTLIKPVLPAAGSYSRWIISPDKDLALLPFDTLAEGYDDKGQPTRMLVESKNLSLVQSFAVYALLKQRDQEYANLVRPKDLLAMGNPVYAEGWSENRGMKRGGTRAFQDRSGRGYALAAIPYADEHSRMQSFDWMNLPGTAREIDAVAKVFGAGNVDRYLGPQASEEKLQQINQTGQLKDYRYLLFSAHGYLARNPSLSSLVLSRKNNPPGVDGYVTSEEWPLYDVRSDLTVLSACDTGVGKTQAGESVMGLPYALFVAGNKNTLLSLWPVDDDATAEFMTRFFGHLKAGKSQPDALRATKQEFLKHPQWSAPRFWAAFTLYGI